MTSKIAPEIKTNNKFRKRLKQLLRPTLTFIFMVIFFVYFRNNRDDFSALGDISPLTILVIAIGQLITILSNVGLLMVIASVKEKSLPAIESARVTTYSSVVNFFGFLQAGLGYRALFLKKNYGITIKSYSAIVFVQYIVLFGFALSMGLIGYLSATQNSTTLFLPVILLMLLILAVVSRKKLFILIQDWIIKSVLLKGINRRHIITTLILSMVQFFGLALAFAAELIAVGANLSLSALLLYTCTAMLSIIVAITPGAIGIRESMLLIVASSMSLSTEEILLSATIDRVVYFSILVVLAPFALSWKRRNNLSQDDQELATTKSR